MTKPLSPQERINHALKGIEIEDELYRVLSKTIADIHKQHVNAFYGTIADALEEKSLNRLLYLCKTGRAYESS